MDCSYEQNGRQTAMPNRLIENNFHFVIELILSLKKADIDFAVIYQSVEVEFSIFLLLIGQCFFCPDVHYEK